MHCRIRIAGTPYLNFLCSVLWCHTFIPSSAPTEPPMIAIQSRVASGMRHLFDFAFHLSMPYMMNVMTLTERRYISNTFINKFIVCSESERFLNESYVNQTSLCGSGSKGFHLYSHNSSDDIVLQSRTCQLPRFLCSLHVPWNEGWIRVYR